MAYISEDHRTQHRIVEVYASQTSDASESVALLGALAWYDRMLESLAGSASSSEAMNLEVARLRAEVGSLSESVDRVKRENADMMGRMRRFREFLEAYIGCVNKLHGLFGKWARGE